MSWNITVRKIDHIKPHSAADRLELGYIGGWQIVIPKGQYSEGDLIVYFPAESLVPEKWLEEWGLTGRLAGKLKNRVKPVRLRGESSIGIVCAAPTGASEGDDMQEYYGIVRWEEPIPVCLQGQCSPKPRTFKKYEVDNIYNDPKALIVGETIYVSEKLHGTNAAYGLVDGEFYACSRNRCLKESEDNLYWQMAHKYDIEGILRKAYTYMDVPDTLWIHGEIFGQGVQDLNYGLTSPEFRFFDIRINDEFCTNKTLEAKFGSAIVLEMYCDIIEKLRSPHCLYAGPYISLEHLKELAGGLTMINQSHIREGVVIKCMDTPYDSKGERRIFKCLNEDYLLRKNGTEHH